MLCTKHFLIAEIFKHILFHNFEKPSPLDPPPRSVFRWSSPIHGSGSAPGMNNSKHRGTQRGLFFLIDHFNSQLSWWWEGVDRIALGPGAHTCHPWEDGPLRVTGSALRFYAPLLLTPLGPQGTPGLWFLAL